MSERIKFDGTQLLGCQWHGDGRLKKISSKMVNFRSNFPHVPQHKSMCFFSFPHQENMGKVSERIKFDGTQLLECKWHGDGRLKKYFFKNQPCHPWAMGAPKVECHQIYSFWHFSHIFLVYEAKRTNRFMLGNIGKIGPEIDDF